MRFLILIVLALVCFAGAIIGAMAVTGNLTKEGLDKLLGKAPPRQAQKVETPDDVDPLLKALDRRREDLDKREAELKKRDERVRLAESQLNTTRGELTRLLKDLEEARQIEDADRASRLVTIAESVAAMKAKKAAEALDQFSPEDAATILQSIDDPRKRGKILDELESDKVANLMETFQNSKS